MDRGTRRLYQLQARVLQAAAHPIRLAVIDFLRDGEQCVCDIARHVSSERSNVSRHLAVMLQAGVLESRRDGLKVMYSLRTPCIANLLTCIGGVLRRRVREEAAAIGRLA